MTTSEAIDDPFASHIRRDPLPDAGIRIILLTDLPRADAEAVIAPLIDHIKAMGRPVEQRILEVDSSDLSHVAVSRTGGCEFAAGPGDDRHGAMDACPPRTAPESHRPL